MDLKDIRVVLASQSPRRKELLSAVIPGFEVIPSYDDEDPKETRPSRVVTELSGMKARDVYEKTKDSTPDDKGLLVIGADTIVSVNGDILGKPADTKDAARMIGMLSGRDHEVFTGVTLYYRPKDKKTPEIRSFFEQTTVTFFPLSEEEIRYLSEEGEPLDKAGAYAIQGAAGRFISRINGDIQNVIGLPVPRLYQELKELLK